MKRVIAALLVAALVGGVIGGGYLLFFSDEVTKEEFVEEADDICLDTRDQAAQIEFGDPTDLQDAGDFYASNLELLEDQTARIKALEPPEEDRATLDDWLNTQDQLAVTFEQAVDAASSDDQKGFDQALANATLIQVRSTELATAYGFTVCGVATPE